MAERLPAVPVLDTGGALGGDNGRPEPEWGGATRALVRLEGAEAKIETSSVTRGVVPDPETRASSDAVADAFGYAEMQIVSFEDLFGG